MDGRCLYFGGANGFEVMVKDDFTVTAADDFTVMAADSFAVMAALLVVDGGGLLHSDDGGLLHDDGGAPFWVMAADGFQVRQLGCEGGKGDEDLHLMGDAKHTRKNRINWIGRESLNSINSLKIEIELVYLNR